MLCFRVVLHIHNPESLVSFEVLLVCWARRSSDTITMPLNVHAAHGLRVCTRSQDKHRHMFHACVLGPTMTKPRTPPDTSMRHSSHLSAAAGSRRKYRPQRCPSVQWAVTSACKLPFCQAVLGNLLGGAAWEPRLVVSWVRDTRSGNHLSPRAACSIPPLFSVIGCH